MVFHRTIISSLYHESRTFGTTCCLIVSFDNGHSKDKYKNKYKNFLVQLSTLILELKLKFKLK